jgi:probable blue pigment (indigoidine) exporter
MPPISHASRSRLSPLGLALLVIASVGWGLNFPIMKHLLTEWPPLSSRGLCGIVGLAVEQPQLAALSSIGWASMVYMTLIQFCLCYVCWFAALERLPAATASIGTLLVPVVGVLAAGAMLHEPLGLRELAALVITLGGVAVALRS